MIQFDKDILLFCFFFLLMIWYFNIQQRQRKIPTIHNLIPVENTFFKITKDNFEVIKCHYGAYLSNNTGK